MTKESYDQAGTALERSHANSPSKVVDGHRAFLEARLGRIEQWVRQGVDARALIRFLLHDLQTNEKLRECTRESLYLGLLACATTGLEPGPLKGEAYLIPFAKQAVFVPGWKGLVKQARRSREVVGIAAELVRENDEFELDFGAPNPISHKPPRSGPRGDVTGAWAKATMRGGHVEVEYMDRDDLERIRKVAEARGKSPAWKDWPDQMARKSPIRRLCKRLPLGADYFVALALEQAHDDGRSQQAVLDIETEGAASAAVDAPAVVVP